MKESLPMLIAMSISSLTFMFLSLKFKWSKKVWMLLTKKVKPQYHAVLWILCAPVLNISLQLLFEWIGIPFHGIMNGITLGFYMGFLPDLGIEK